MCSFVCMCVYVCVCVCTYVLFSLCFLSLSYLHFICLVSSLCGASYFPFRDMVRQMVRVHEKEGRRVKKRKEMM